MATSEPSDSRPTPEDVTPSTGDAPSTLARRRLLQASAAAGGALAMGGTALTAPAAAAQAAAAPAQATDLAQAATKARTVSFSAATNGAATLVPGADRMVAEMQNILWSIPRSGGTARALSVPGLEPTRPVLAPDGKTVAVCAYHDGGFHIWTLRADGSGLEQHTDGPWDDRGPAWSPDGTRIAFASEREGDPVKGSPYRIWVLDVRSGELTRLTGRKGQQGPLQDGAWEDFDPAWSPDGERVLCVRGSVVTGETGPQLRARTLVSVAADGSGDVRTEHEDETEGVSLMTPAVSPSGKVAYLRTTPAPKASCTLVVDGKAVRIEGDLAPVPPRWADRETLLLTVSGTFRLLRPARPESAERIPFTAELPTSRPRYRVKDYGFEAPGSHRVRGVQQPVLSPDGKHLAFVALNALWLARTDGRGRPRKLVQAPEARYICAPSFTRDGKALLYSDDRAGLLAVRRRELDSGEEKELAAGGRVFGALSPDGTKLACLDMAGNLIVKDLPGGRERTLAEPLGGGGIPGPPTWSPDGRHLALCDRNRLNYRFREGYNLIRVLDADSGAEALHALAPHASLADRYAAGPVWSPDGKWMAAVSESALWVLPVRSDGSPAGEARRLSDESADHPSWSGDSGSLLYLSAGKLRLREVHDGKPGKARTVRLELSWRRPAPKETVVHAGRLWDGTGEGVREDVDLVLRDGRIAEIAPHRAGRRAERRLDASGLTVLPGLWDTHTHPWQTTYGGRQTVTQLAYGITTAVSLGGFSYEQARLREAVAAGQLAGPRLLATGELLDGARVAYSMGRAHRTAEGLRRSLERGGALGWDFVKTYVRAPATAMRQAAQYAHEELGVRSGSHLCTPGVQIGQDLTTHLQATQRLEFGHATTGTGHAYEDLVGIYSTPGDFHLVATPFTALPLLGAHPELAEDERVTRLLPPWDVQAVRQSAATPPTEDQLATLDVETAVYRRVLAAGGLVALGTDQPLVPIGLHLHLALRALHRAGLKPHEALRTATVLPARVFGAERELGTVEEGKLADLTLVDGNPLTDFDSLVRTVTVVRGGVPYEQKDLIDAYSSAQQRAHTGGQEAHWRQVSRQLRRDGCCDMGH
ncbi:PD40 domain-containing protein [Streptomyces oryzae]|uniref:PD40 domain-containing protein n=1 Tax=Streptomyces oryzae TaxID=1434886 RepID=A0ABS3X528_9ACTN|nr:amidohydrolase family protein [Streptomyces oryzae]MBO8190434.1 PD40 domain-containing protein [Streptomyces oryzae]